MKGDFGRLRFQPNKHYTLVLEQQGRVALDADANEQGAIYEHLRRTETVDVIGEYGAPDGAAGFAVSVEGTEIRIGRGRYYVGGLLCENQRDVSYDAQRYYVDPGTTAAQLLEDLAQQGGDATIQVYLEVWQRLVTALDDTCLLEPAIGQADTTCRLQTVWRVVAAVTNPRALAKDLSSPDSEALASTLTSCCEGMYRETRAARSGSLSAQTSGGGADCGCQPIASAGYQGLENQLYRVEVHQSGNAATATFKWSRENGSVVTAIQSVSGPNVVVASLGPDANLGYKVGDWVEISDDTYLFGDTPNRPGLLYQIQQISPATLTVTMTTTVLSIDPTRNARMRRWDQTGASASSSGVALSGSWIDLENGIQVSFGEGDYVSGDYWTIPARTATGTIDWPPCGGDQRPFQPPHHAPVYRAPLACIHYRKYIPYIIVKGQPPPSHYTVDDCRRLFPTLTRLAVPTTPSALHVTAINWLNDDVMTFDDLLKNGLAVTFDQAPTSPFDASNFIVTLEIPGLSTAGRELVSDVSNVTLLAKPALREAKLAVGTTGATGAGATGATGSTGAAAAAGGTAAASIETLHEIARFRNLTVSTIVRSEIVLDSSVAVSANVATWTMPLSGASLQLREVFALDELLTLGLTSPYNWPGRARVKLLGRALFASANNGYAYLDGQAFGQIGTATNGGGQRTDLQFPSGNDAKASDFESWFFLYPALDVTDAELAYTSMTVATTSSGAVSVSSTTANTATNAPTPSTAGTQELEVYLNYAAVKSASLTLQLSGDDLSLVSVPSSFAIKQGQSAVIVPVAITGAPSDGQTLNYTITLWVNNAVWPSSTYSSTTATFSLVGGRSYDPIQ